MEGGSSVTLQRAVPRDEDRSELSPLVGKAPLFSLDGIDRSAKIADRDAIAKYIPHRPPFSLLDWLVWESVDFMQGIALWNVRDDEFWVPGHFPDRPMLPGVLMVEAGAELTAYLFARTRGNNPLGAFTRIERAAFRASVEPGEAFYLLAQGVRHSTRGFVTDVQGIVGDRIVFEARVAGLDIANRP